MFAGAFCVSEHSFRNLNTTYIESTQEWRQRFLCKKFPSRILNSIDICPYIEYWAMNRWVVYYCVNVSWDQFHGYQLLDQSKFQGSRRRLEYLDQEDRGREWITLFSSNMNKNLFGMFVCMSCAPVDNIQELHFAILDPPPTIHNFFLKINWGFCSENKTKGL